MNLNHPWHHAKAYKKFIQIGPALKEEFSDNTCTVELYI